MAFINLASANKKSRASQISTSLGTAGTVSFYTGTPPASPDLTATGLVSGNPLCVIPLANPAAVAYTYVVSAAITTAGANGTPGTQTVTGTTGTGTMFQASVTIDTSGAGGTTGKISAVNSITVAGQYSVSPSNLNGEVVTGASLTGATLSLVMSGVTVFQGLPLTATAGQTGTAGYARMATSGGVGIVDLDVGAAGSGDSFIITSTAVVAGGSVSITSASITES